MSGRIGLALSTERGGQGPRRATVGLDNDEGDVWSVWLRAMNLRQRSVETVVEVEETMIMGG
jgi:hypothetical protein